MDENNCVFCSIVSGQLPAAKVYEDDFILCFMDKYPINLGHVLVIPKHHYETFLHMPEKEICKLYISVSKLSRFILKAVRADGFNIGQNNGRSANQIVPHVHVHIIPRFINNNGKWPTRRIIPFDELMDIANKIAIIINNEKIVN